MVSRKIKPWLEQITRYANRWWFEPAMALLSALDAFILIVPNEALIAAGVVARPKRWLSMSIWMIVGSALGAAVLAAVVGNASGWILSHLVSAKTLRSSSWRDSVKLIDAYGVWGLALISLSPLPQHAAVAFAGLMEMPARKVFFAVLVGRALKYIATGWLAAKAPHVLRKWKILPKEGR